MNISAVLHGSPPKTKDSPIPERNATSPPLIALVAVGLRLRLAALPGNRSALAPQVGGSIVPIQYGLNPRSISLMVGVGTVLSLVSLPLWWRIFAGW